MRWPKFKEGCPQVSIREGPEELTLTTEVGSKKACINVDHIAEDMWRPPLVGTEWRMPSAKQSTEELKATYKEMRRQRE